jgi:hypothetical protein
LDNGIYEGNKEAGHMGKYLKYKRSYLILI